MCCLCPRKIGYTDYEDLASLLTAKVLSSLEQPQETMSFGPWVSVLRRYSRYGATLEICNTKKVAHHEV